MNFKEWLVNFVITFIITLIVAAVVTFIWNYLVHKTCGVNWETAFTLAIIFGIVFPTMDAMKK